MSFAEELRAKQQDIMSKVVSRGAQALQGRLVTEAKFVAARIPGALVLVPPQGAKTLTRAKQKVMNDYGGDWLRIKDMARCTLMVPFQHLLDQTVAALRAHFRANNGFTVIEEKTTIGAFNAGGYSGLTVFVESGGNKGEVQVNTVPLLYAKSLPEFLAAMPEKEAEMKATYPLVPGGLGHALYDTFRVQETTPTGRAYAHASKLYFNYFRSYPPNMNWGKLARDAVNALHITHV